jgi:hypothetical protein
MSSRLMRIGRMVAATTPPGRSSVALPDRMRANPSIRSPTLQWEVWPSPERAARIYMHHAYLPYDGLKSPT